jgi:hypothetical protein
MGEGKGRIWGERERTRVMDEKTASQSDLSFLRSRDNGHRNRILVL